MSAGTQDPSDDADHASTDPAARDREAERPTITDHARDQWVDRICSHQDGVAPWDIYHAFKRSLAVGIDGSGRGRLHAPTGAVFVFKRNWSRGPPVVLTTLTEAMLYLGDDHLKPCPECGRRYNAGVRPCPWCQEDNS